MKMRRMLLSLGVFSTMLAVTVGGIGVWGLQVLERDVDSSATSTAAVHTATLGDMMHDALRADVYAALLHAELGQAEGVAKAQEDCLEHGHEFLADLQKLQGMALSPEARSQFEQLKPTVTRYVAQAQEITKLALHDRQAAQARLPGFLKLFKQLEGDQEVAIGNIELSEKAAQAEAESARTFANRALFAAIVLGGMAMLGASWVTTRTLMRTLGAEPDVVRKILDRVSTGELGVQIRVEPGNQDSVLSQVAHMVAQLRTTVAHVRDNADHVASASSQVAAGSNDLSNRTQDQAAALERSASALEQLSSTVSHNADNAAQATQLAQGASDVAAHGGDMVTQLVGTMQDIHQSSQKISEIISVIDGIAFQTNILALNAAVEAARAGEQGRGFAVVAGEVRSLAQRSAGAAREIKTLINSSVERVTMGAQQADQTGATMKSIVDAIAKVTDVIAEISCASREQTAGIAQVTDAVVNMDQGTQSNAALVEETAAAALSLREQAAQLARSVATFRLEHVS